LVVYVYAVVCVIHWLCHKVCGYVF